jgi:hypothetical protein
MMYVVKCLDCNKKLNVCGSIAGAYLEAGIHKHGPGRIEHVVKIDALGVGGTVVFSREV